MKQLYLKILFLCLLSAASTTLFSQSSYVRDEVDGITYYFESNLTAFVTRSLSYSGDVVIPSIVTYEGQEYTVTAIGINAFEYAYDMTSVTIPSSVTSIGRMAFVNCRKLSAVYITDLSAWVNIQFESYFDPNFIYEGHESNPLYYAHHLFLNGEEVKDLVVPDKVTSISDRAFVNCDGLTSVTIPDGVTTIGEYNQEIKGKTNVEIIPVSA